MANEFRLPDIGEGLHEAEIVSWRVPVGGTVALDEVIVEVETDKAVVEIPSPFAGVVLHHGAAEGEVVEVGRVLVVVGEEGETWPPAEPAGEARSFEVAPIVGTLSEEADVLAPVAVQGASRVRVLALPLVRKLARQLGVDLTAVEGSGPDGHITREDVMKAAEGSEDVGVPAAKTASVPEAAEEPPPPRPPSAGLQRVPMTRLRRTIAANMSASWREIPHVTTFDEAEGARLLEARRALETRHGVRIPLEALVAKALVPVLHSYPQFNASVDGDDLILHADIHMGVAVDTDDGLLVVVVRDVARAGLLDLSAEIVRLAEGARQRALAPFELGGQTFTLSNIGALGGGFGTPIVPHGTTAILSVGRAVDKPVVRGGAIEIGRRIPLSLSYDHRAIDGGLGRRFMAMVLENLAEPALFLTGA